jgi:hypothetical protein
VGAGPRADTVRLNFAAWGYNTQRKLVMEIEIPAALTGTIIPPFNGTFRLNGKGHNEGSVTFAGKRKVAIEEE